MLTEIKGLRHVPSVAAALRNNGFFTEALGRRRVEKTVNSDERDKARLVPPAG